MLARILELLRAEGALTIDDLARETGASTEALRGMLDTLGRRRLIEWDSRSGTTSSCGINPPAPPVVTLSIRSEKNGAPGRAGGKWTAKTRGR
jgi:predicted ArsR family transcriptional regulator